MRSARNTARQPRPRAMHVPPMWMDGEPWIDLEPRILQGAGGGWDLRPREELETDQERALHDARGAGGAAPPRPRLGFALPGEAETA